ncbi:MAG: hypothetical protein AAF664_21270 [Planctomycetota bacterium]
MTPKSNFEPAIEPNARMGQETAAQSGILVPPAAVRFDADEVRLARELKRAGMPWQPAPGQFVIDEKNLIQRGSPFQSGVYFILNFERFVTIAGGMSELLESMTWLPTFEQCREILRGLGIDNQMQVDQLSDQRSFESGRERVDLYRLILECLQRND